MSDPYAIRYAVFDYGEPTPDLVQPPIGFHSVYQFPGWENRAPGWIMDVIQRFKNSGRTIAGAAAPLRAW